MKFLRLSLLLLTTLCLSIASAIPPDGESAEVQNYIKAYMQAYFNPVKGQVRPVYKALNGWLHESYSAAAVPVEKFTNTAIDSDRVVLQCHGGGYVLGLNQGYRFFAQRQAQALQARTIYTFDYRHAPKHTHPAALEDAVTVYRQLLSEGCDPHKLLVIGDSAGGNLALSLCLKLRELKLPQPQGLILISPWTALNELPSRTAYFKRDKVLGEHTPLNQAVASPAYAEGYALSSPELSPVYADLSGLPPLLIQAGGYEILRSDSEMLKEAADRYGLEARLSIYPGMPHDFPLVMPDLPQSQSAFEEMGAFAQQLCDDSQSPE
ncbi:MAG: alpha/beta hydrolase [Succinivibrio sp.]|nr:alpha/beta hydrolase [Succinivibrio sp.]